MYTIDVLLRHFAKNNYIFEVDEAKLQFNAEQVHVYGTLKCTRCIGESERHSYKEVEIMMGRISSLNVICIIKIDLSTFAFSIKRRIDGRFASSSIHSFARRIELRSRFVIVL